MKILCIVKWLINGGAEKNAINIINYLAEKSNYSIDLLIMQNDKENYLEQFLSPKINNIYYDFNKLELAKFLIQNRKKYAHVFGGDHRIGVYLSIYKFLFPVFKWKTSCRCINNLSILLSKKNNIEKLFFTFFLKRIDLVISQCESMSKDLHNNWKIKNPLTIYNPIIKKKTKSIYSSNLDTLHFLYLGRFSQQKRLSFLVKAFHIALEKVKFNKELRLTLVGYRNWMEEDKKTYDELKEYIKINKLENNIFIEEYTKNTEIVFQEANILLLSSKYEGFPNVLLEANSYGLPVVSTNCNFGPSEIISDGFNGYLSSLDSIPEFSEKILLATNTNWDSLAIIESTNIYSEDIQYGKFLDKIVLLQG